jgi:hypothetical protein
MSNEEKMQLEIMAILQRSFANSKKMEEENPNNMIIV